MPKHQRKLKLGKGSSFVKSRLSRLPQEDVIREADFCPLPEVLSGHGLWLGLVVSHHDGSILAQAVPEELAGWVRRAFEEALSLDGLR